MEEKKGWDPLTCEKCGQLVGQRIPGVLFPHTRFVEEAGAGPNQSHEREDCPGGGPK